MPTEQLAHYELHGMQPVLGVRDIMKTVEYYRDKLGFHVDLLHGDPPQHARVNSNPSHSGPAIHIRFEPLIPPARPNPSVYFFIHVGRDLDQLCARYRDRGVKIIDGPEDQPFGI